jgi:hypothetical protein
MLAPRLIALVVLWLLAFAGYTLAADGGQPTTPPTESKAAKPSAPATLTVPDVRGKPYVFAKGILQDAGFAWKVSGSVHGYAANTVANQKPAPSLRVVDNGAPTVVLVLARNADYAERGVPENAAPFAGTAVVSLSQWRAAHLSTGESTTTETEPQTTDSTPTQPEATASQPTESTPTESTTTEPQATESQPTETAPGSGGNDAEPKSRKPDFVVKGAPAEPAHEMPLPARARLLERQVDAASRSSKALVRHWLYQHSWLVTGARFGWADGDKALEVLLRVDRKLERRFGYGARSARVVQQALAYVRRHEH